MKANRAFQLNVTRSGTAPAFLAGADRIDHVEIVEIDSGEAVLFWDLTAGDTSKLARRLRADMAQMSGDEFMTAWRDFEPYAAG